MCENIGLELETSKESGILPTLSTLVNEKCKTFLCDSGNFLKASLSYHECSLTCHRLTFNRVISHNLTSHRLTCI